MSYLREDKAAVVIAIMETLLKAEGWVPAGEFHAAVLDKTGLVEEIAQVTGIAAALAHVGIIRSSTPGTWGAETKVRLEGGWIDE